MPEEIYRHTKTNFSFFPRIFTIVGLALLGTGSLTLGESPINLAPYLALGIFALDFKWLIWEWKPQRWSLTLGPKALIFEENGKRTSIPKKDIARILASQTKRGTKEYILLQTDGSFHVIPQACIGNTLECEKTMTTLGYPLETVEA